LFEKKNKPEMMNLKKLQAYIIMNFEGRRRRRNLDDEVR